MDNLPQKYHFLLSIEDLPKTISEALKMLGVQEVVGMKHSSVIMGWAKALGLEKIYTNDELSWCGLFAAWVITRAGKFIPFKSWDLLRALSYQKFGIAVKEPMLGDVVVFKREGGGHVGFYIAESKTTYAVIGGNQSNRVSITEIAKDRAVAFRRPVYQNQPLSVKKYIISSTGVVSTNEA